MQTDAIIEICVRTSRIQQVYLPGRNNRYSCIKLHRNEEVYDIIIITRVRSSKK